MEELLIKIFTYLGILLLLISVVSIFLYSRGMIATRKSIYISSMFMLLGFISWGGVVFILKPTQVLLTVYFLLLGGCVTGIHLVWGIVSLALKDKINREQDQRIK